MFNKRDSVLGANEMIDEFINMLYMTGTASYRIIQFALAVLCKCKGTPPVLQTFESELENIKIPKEEIDRYVYRIKYVCGEHLDEVLPSAGEYVLKKMSSALHGGILSQPSELTALVHSLMRERGCRHVYNPFASYGYYGVADFIEKYHGQEEFKDSYHVARMLLYLNNIDDTGMENTDPLVSWNDYGADCIVSTPRIGYTLYSVTKRDTHAKDYVEYVVSSFLSSTVQYGFFVVPRAFCIKTHGAFDLRKTICEKNVLEMVVSLPSGLFSSVSGISMSLLVLNRNRQKNDDIILVDADRSFKLADNKERILDTYDVLRLIHEDKSDHVARVKRADLFEFDCSFECSHYMCQEIVLKDGQSLMAIGSVLERDKGVRCMFTGDVVTNVLQGQNYVTDISKFGDVNNQVPVSQPKFRFHGPHIAFNLQGKIYIHRGDTDFYVGSALSRYVFKVNENVVNIEYLAMALLSNHILQRALTGGGIPQINVNVLLKSQIPVDSFVRQAQIVGRMKRLFLNEEKKRLNVREAGGDLSHMLGAPQDSINHLLSFLLESENLPEEEKGWVKAIEDNFNFMSRLIEIVGADFSALKGTHHEIQIASLLSDYSRALKNLKYSNCFEVQLQNDMADLSVSCDKDLLRIMLDAAILNAYRHGFSKRYESGNKLLLRSRGVMYNDKVYVCISIANNGQPLEKGFSKEDFATSGKKTGMMGNTGKGGYHIYAIAKMYEGYINVTLSKEWPFILDVLLPATNLNSNQIFEEYGDKCI